MKSYWLFGILAGIGLGDGCTAQTSSSTQTDTYRLQMPVGGGCDGCELMYVGMPAQIASVDTSAGWAEVGQQLLITGTVRQPDGYTPARDVIIYYWQTDAKGYYSPKSGMDEKAKRHGHIRGWVKTDKEGRYAIYTNRPAPYPNKTMPAHIHLAIKEPAIANEYYVDELVFDDDPLLLPAIKKKPLENRGGSGIVRVVKDGNLQVAEHLIVLGLHIPNYPKTTAPRLRSGLSVGEDSPSFTPYHAFGPDKGTRTCPVCKYGRHQGILYFVGNKPQWAYIRKWLLFLEQLSGQYGNYLKVYFVYGNQQNYSKNVCEKELEKLGNSLNLKHIALTFVPALTDTASDIYLNRINPNVESTFVIYRHRTIVGTFTDLPPTADGFQAIKTLLEQTKSPYADLPEPTFHK